MKKIQIFSIILFLAILAVPIITVNFKPNQISEADNRELEEFPKNALTMEGHYQFESALNDRIGFRNEMILGYTLANDRLFDVMIHPTYTYGKDGYIFFQMGFEKVNKPYLDTYADFVSQMQEDCERQGITFRYWLNPSKIRVYDDKLPEGVHLKHKDITYLLEQLDLRGIVYTSTLELLSEERNKQQVFNVQFDAGHWNDTGAFIGTAAMLQDLINSGVDIKNISKDEFRSIRAYYDTLPVSYFPIQDSSDIYDPVNQTAVLDSRYDNEVEMDSQYNEFAYYINEEKKEEPKALIFRGSYLEEREKFLVNQFSETALVHSYNNVQHYQYYIDMFKPDVVIFECAEYAIGEDLYPWGRLNEALGIK